MKCYGYLYEYQKKDDPRDFIYCGITDAPHRRWAEHQKNPMRLHPRHFKVIQAFPSRSLARQWEIQTKKLSHHQKKQMLCKEL